MTDLLIITRHEFDGMIYFSQYWHGCPLGQYMFLPKKIFSRYVEALRNEFDITLIEKSTIEPIYANPDWRFQDATR